MKQYPRFKGRFWVCKHYILAIKPIISKHQQEQRFEFALQYIDYENEFEKSYIHQTKKNVYTLKSKIFRK